MDDPGTKSRSASKGRQSQVEPPQPHRSDPGAAPYLRWSGANARHPDVLAANAANEPASGSERQLR